MTQEKLELRSSRSARYRWRAMGIAATAAGVLAIAHPADAGSIYRGGFDPLLLSGTISIDLVDVGCVNNSPGFNEVIPGITLGCSQVDVVDATAKIFNTVTSTTTTYTFGAQPGVITGLWWNSGVLDAITTTGSLPADLVGPSTSPTGYFLQFNASLVSDTLTSSVVLFQQTCTGDTDEDEGDGSDDDRDGCTLTAVGDPALNEGPFVRVPEPGSLALVLGALGAGWLGLRRRRSA